MSKKIASIQGLRVILFLCIFLFHCGTPLFSIGWGGVNVFLVLTSFLLTSSLTSKSRQSIRVLSTIKYRVNRIYPSYILIVIFCCIIFIIVNNAFPRDLISLILCSQNFWWAIDGLEKATPLTGHLWYITLDIYLCAIWIIALKVIPRNRLNIFFILCIIMGVIWRVGCVMLKTSSIVSYIIPIGQIDSFALGGLISLFPDSNSAKSIRRAYLIIALGLLGIFLCLLISSLLNKISFTDAFMAYHSAEGYADNVFTINIFLFMGILGSGLILLCLNYPNMPILSSPLIVSLGGLTYLLYLVHYPLIIIVKKFVSSTWYMIIIAFLFSILVSYIYEKVSKKSFLKYIKNYK